MFLRQKNTKHLVEVLEPEEVYDPNRAQFTGRLNVGEEMPDPEQFSKDQVCFPSGEDLPRCWVDAHYRDDEIRH